MKKCPVCSNNLKLKYRLSSEIFHCTSCDLFVAPDIQFNESFYSDINQDKAAQALKDLRVDNFKHIMHVITTELPGTTNGLDVGCSYGWFLQECKNNDISCVGIEPEPALAKQAQQDGHNVICGFFPEVLEDRTPRFDFIIFNDVFEHIPNINKTLESCHQLLKDNGTLIINIPLSSGFFYKTAGLLYKLGIKKPMNRMWQLQFHSPHFHYFNQQNLVELLKNNGFSLFKFHNLAVITKKSIRSRIEMDRKQSLFSKLMTTGLELSYPVIKKMPSDIGCFYFKKEKRLHHIN